MEEQSNEVEEFLQSKKIDNYCGLVSENKVREWLVEYHDQFKPLSVPIQQDKINTVQWLRNKGFTDVVYPMEIEKFASVLVEYAESLSVPVLPENKSKIPPDAYDLEVFSIKGKEAFIGYKIPNGNFHFIQVPFTQKEGVLPISGKLP